MVVPLDGTDKGPVGLLGKGSGVPRESQIRSMKLSSQLSPKVGQAAQFG